jgi:hypothetical protein
MENKTKTNLLRIGNIIFFLIAITVNVLANAVKINGKGTGELSDAIPNLFVPSGITFAVWGVIYLLLLVFTVYQARGLFRSDEAGTAVVKTIGALFIISCIANAAWIFAWHYLQILLSLVIMLVLLVVLITMYLRLGIGKARVGVLEKLCVHVPFSVYLAWISVATIANVTALLVTLGWNGFGLSEAFWAVFMIVIAALLALAGLLVRGDIAFSLVFAWAFFGIYLKRMGTGPLSVPEVAFSALVALCVVLAGVLVAGIRLFLKTRHS